MYLLQWIQGESTQFVGIFDTIESGRDFMRRVPGYRLSVIEEENFSFEEESIEWAKLPDIAMIEYKGCKVPVSRFSFESDVTVLWTEIEHLDAERKREASSGGAAGAPRKTAAGATRIDAYSINNEEVEAYVRKREAQFAKISALLEEAGFEVSRECFGSEDGEVIFIRSKGSEEDQKEKRWRFLTHMDPFFVEMDIESEIGELLAE